MDPYHVGISLIRVYIKIIHIRAIHGKNPCVRCEPHFSGARWSLTAARWSLAVTRWSLADARWSLAAARWSLAVTRWSQAAVKNVVFYVRGAWCALGAAKMLYAIKIRNLLLRSRPSAHCEIVWEFTDSLAPSGSQANMLFPCIIRGTLLSPRTWTWGCAWAVADALKSWGTSRLPADLNGICKDVTGLKKKREKFQIRLLFLL